MKKLFSCLLIATLLTISISQVTNAFSDPFSDTPAQYEDAILYLADQGIVQGYSDGTVKPYNTINRAEFTKILVEGNDMTPDVTNYNNCFSDVTNDWYAPYVCYAKTQGWVEGYPDGSFMPAQPINRVEMIKLVLETQNYSIPSATSAYLYADVDSTQWYAPYVEVGKNYNIIQSQGDNLYPGYNVTRGESFETLYRALIINELDLSAYDKAATDALFSRTPTTALTGFQSDFFNENLSGLAVPAEMNDETLNDLTKYNARAYKLAAALYMLGYTYNDNNDQKLHVELLNKFQANNSFEESSMLTEEVAMEIDSQLADYEAKFNGYSQNYPPMFDHTDPVVLENVIPKDYIAWLMTSPLEALPANLKMSTTEEMVYCIAGQCVGGFNDESGTRLGWNIVPTGNYVYTPDVFYKTTDYGFMRPSSSQAQVNIHEYAHYLDGRDTDQPLPEYPHYRMIKTVDFYNISFDYDFNNTEQGYNGSNNISCFPLKSDIQGFISYYAYDSFPNYEGDCPTGTSAAQAEDFAESFSFYVTAGKDFRAAAAQNSFVNEKYNWLKTNVFNGTEYNTELTNINATYTGCPDGDPDFLKDGPGYLSCDDGFIWNGTLPKL